MNKVEKSLAILGLGLATVFGTAGCTDPETATRVLDDAGFKNINADGFAPFDCGENDVYRTKFTAQNQNGKTVSGAVCAGLPKNSTIRFD
jgi:hypothetical protein